MHGTRGSADDSFALRPRLRAAVPDRLLQGSDEVKEMGKHNKLLCLLLFIFAILKTAKMLRFQGVFKRINIFFSCMCGHCIKFV